MRDKRKTPTRVYAFCCFALLIGCRGSPSGPVAVPWTCDYINPDIQEDAYLSGVLHDQDGKPIEGAAVSLVYGFEGFDPAIVEESHVTKVLVEPGKSVPEVEDLPGSLFCYQTLDYRRQLVWQMSGHTDSIRPEWSGNDFDGKPLPNGLYYRRLRTESSFLEAKVFILAPIDDPSLAARSHATTDAKGRFQIPLGLMPLHEWLSVESGGSVSSQRVSREVTVVAMVQENGIMRQISRNIVILRRDQSMEILLEFP